ncbi:MAG: electron transfer flavoprotein subunit beta/FixA family protein [Flavobacteriaceae bacterium]|nr:electron transfer flavoprotein subunit beta/FixA family protein [Flavobacteriaceae bacterium]
MKILVCISCVPDTTSKINFINNETEFDNNGVQYIINPNDEFGLTKAIFLKQKNNAEVTVASVGNVNCESILRKCLAIGADKSIRINAIAEDGFIVAKEIASLCKTENFDLIITGRESIDYNGGMVGGLLAGILNYDYISNCIQLDIEGSKALAAREIDGGKEILDVSLPLVIGSQKGLVEEKDLIIPNMRGIMQARQKPLSVIESCGALSKSKTKSFQKPEEKSEVKLVDPNNIQELITLLHNEAKVI